MTRYVDIDEVIAIHTEMIWLFGGRPDIHDFTMLHSAIERPKATFGGIDLYPITLDIDSHKLSLKQTARWLKIFLLFHCGSLIFKPYRMTENFL